MQSVKTPIRAQKTLKSHSKIHMEFQGTTPSKKPRPSWKRVTEDPNYSCQTYYKDAVLKTV